MEETMFQSLFGSRSQRDDWEWLRSQKGEDFRNLLSRRFERKFPSGHETSLRPFVTQVATQRARGAHYIGALKLLNNVHPAALTLLLEYGVDYSPYEWESMPFEPKPNHCFSNAWVLAHIAAEGSQTWQTIPSPNLYVEGLAYGSVVRPMLHAWNTEGFDSHVAIDWTHYSVCPWSRYLGISLTLDEYWSICRLKYLDMGCSILHKEHLTDQMLDRLVSILETRRK